MTVLGFLVCSAPQKQLHQPGFAKNRPLGLPISSLNENSHLCIKRKRLHELDQENGFLSFTAYEDRCPGTAKREAFLCA
jgi:hypothetical protein